jgi:2-phosphoglycerate kinase
MIARRQENYFSQAFQYIINHNEPIVVFGRRTPNEFEELPVHDSIKFAMVLIPEEDHRRNCASRKQELRNPLPFFHHWTTDFDKISQLRNNLTDYAKQHDIPVYDSFTDAIDNMRERYALRP